MTKRRLFIFSFFVIIFLGIISLTSCDKNSSGSSSSSNSSSNNNNNNGGNAKHTHTFSDEWVYIPAGHRHAATCHENVFTETEPHVYDGNSTYEEENGVYFKVDECTVCGYKNKTRHYHDYGPEQIIEDSTCTKEGSATKECNICHHIETYAIGKKSHHLIYNTWKDPSCTEIGWTSYYTCENCDYIQGYEELPIQHQLEHHDAQAPTCTDVGWDEYDTCRLCDYTTYHEIPATGHSFEEEWSADDYQHWHKETCGHYSARTYENHSYGDWEIVDEPTMTEKGSKQRECSVCHHIQVADVDPYATYRDNGNDTLYVSYSSPDLTGNVVIPEEVNGKKVTAIRYAFNDNQNITSVRIPRYVTEISNSFKNCPNLTTVYWDAEAIRSIESPSWTNESSTFYYVTLISIQEHGNLALQSSMYLDIFVDPILKNVQGYEVVENNTYHTIKRPTVQNNNGQTYKVPALFDITGNKLCAFPLKQTGVAIDFADLEFTDITDFALYHLTCNSIYLPNTLKVIGPAAFLTATFTEITLPESVTTIYQGAFYHCEKLTTINWNAIHAETSYTPNSSLNHFDECPKLTTIKFGAKVEYIAYLYHADNVTTITYEGTKEAFAALEKQDSRWYQYTQATQVSCNNGVYSFSS